MIFIMMECNDVTETKGADEFHSFSISTNGVFFLVEIVWSTTVNRRMRPPMRVARQMRTLTPIDCHQQAEQKATVDGVKSVSFV